MPDPGGTPGPRILILNGSPKLRGNTVHLIDWFCEGAQTGGVEPEVVPVARLRLKVPGCQACRKCQAIEPYQCSIKDAGQAVMEKVAHADALVLATPLYFFAASAQLKTLVDRLFCMYKWDNAANTMRACLAGKPLVLLASAYEDAGLAALAEPFRLTADYTGMPFHTLLVPNAGVSGDIVRLPGIPDQARDLGARIARDLVRT